MPGVASFQRELSGGVRIKALKIVEDVLDDKVDYGLDFKKALLLRLAGSLLPRLQEHSGEDGEPIPIAIYGGLSRYNSDKEGICPDQKNQSSSGGDVGIKDNLNPDMAD